MKRFLWSLLAALLVASPFVVTRSAAAAGPGQWSKARADAWYAKQPWLVGSNYIPSNADNELQMWQAATFDPERINLELTWAQALGMNTMRVFLQNLLWKQDPKGFLQRVNSYLTIAAKHHIRTIFVLFDSDWDPDPHLGPQPPPIPGVHNSRWVQSPGIALDDPKDYPEFEAYVKGVVGAFAKDPRVLAWDVWNEPDNPGGGNYGPKEPKDKLERVTYLLPRVFAWARSAHPMQPLTSGLWHGGPWNNPADLNAIERIQLENSDIITFHNYSWPEDFERRVHQLQVYGRPIICTEYMAPQAGSTIDTILPIGKRLNVGMLNWGLVKGKTQTYFPWSSWQHPFILTKPTVWFQDLLHKNGRPYRERAAQVIWALSHRPKGVVPNDVLYENFRGVPKVLTIRERQRLESHP